MKFRFIKLGTVVLCAACGQFSFAQSDTTVSTATSNDDALTEIVVTATRREENLQHTAIAISTISGNQLQREGITGTEDLNKEVPGLGLSANGAITQVYLRGVGTFSQPNGDSSVLVSIDQVVMGALAMIGGQFYDLQRVEVLKGPQGTLYGRNATAGAINIISNKPTFTDSGEASLEIGDYHLVKFTGAINQVVTDTFAVRLAGQYVTRDGYFNDGSGNEDLRSFRLQGLYKPSETFSALMSADYVHQGGTGVPAVPFPFADPNNPYNGPSTAAAHSVLPAFCTGCYRVTDNQYVNSDIYGAHAQIDWDLDVGTLTVIPAYRRAVFGEILNPGFEIPTDFVGSQESLEARFASDKNIPLKWLVGAFYFADRSVQVDDPNLGLAEQDLTQDRKDKSYALFGDTTYSVTNAFRVEGGLRYTEEKRNLTGYLNSISAPANPFGSGAFPLPPGAGDFPFSGEVSNNNVSGKVGVEYDLTDASLLYANVSDAFRSGGINQDIAPNTYKPEKLTAYTIGSKNRFFENKLQANLELFYWDYKNHQENLNLPLNGAPGGTSVLTKNIGKATIEGVSMDVQYLITQDDLVSVQPEYLEAVFDSFVYVSPDPVASVAPTTGCATTGIPAAVQTPGVPAAATGTTRVDCSDKPFTRAPKWTTNAFYQHTFRLGDSGQVLASAHTHVASADYVATDYIPAERQAGYALTDVDVVWVAPNERWSVAGYCRNVTDRTIITSSFEHPFIAGLASATLNPPRTYGVQFKVTY